MYPLKFLSALVKKNSFKFDTYVRCLKLYFITPHPLPLFLYINKHRSVIFIIDELQKYYTYFPYLSNGGNIYKRALFCHTRKTKEAILNISQSINNVRTKYHF